MTQIRRSGPAQGRPDTTYNLPQGSPASTPLPTAEALLLPRTGRRTMDAAVVLRCVYCKRSHLHRGYKLNGAVRPAGCHRALEYVLLVRR
jgi:hypothetical protein